MVMEADDIIDYTLSLVCEEMLKAGINFPVEISKRIDRRARDTWGGCEPYIAHRKGADREERDARIRARARNGQLTTMLAANFNLSTRQVNRIIHSKDS